MSTFDTGDWVSNVVHGPHVFLLNKMNIDVKFTSDRLIIDYRVSDYYRHRIKKGVNFPSNVMAVRRGCSGTDILVVYLHSLSKQVHSVHVSIVTYFRPGAQNCNLYDYYMINILNVIVVRSNAAFLKWTCFCLPHLLSYKQSVLQIHCLYYVIDILFSNL